MEKVMRHDGCHRVSIYLDTLTHLLWPTDDQDIRQRKPRSSRVAWTGIDQRDMPPQFLREPDERDRIVSRPENHERDRRLDHLDEDFCTTGGHCICCCLRSAA